MKRVYANKLRNIVQYKMHSRGNLNVGTKRPTKCYGKLIKIIKIKNGLLTNMIQLFLINFRMKLF